MIQRIQSIWIVLGIVLEVLLLCQYSYSFELLTGIIVFASSILLVIISFLALFMFKKRKTQMRLCRLVVLFSIILYIMWSSEWYYGQWHLCWLAVIPLCLIVLHILAYVGINKDEKLIRSVDRLR